MLTLVIGNQNYSSWSLRPWLLLRHHGLPFKQVRLSLDTPGFAADIARWSPAGRVPVLHDDNVVIWDSLAICEYLSERYLDGAGWPSVLDARALARSLVAEMHSGFGALRAELPMNVRRLPSPVRMSPFAEAEVARVVCLWEDALARSGGPWLFGGYSIADAFYAPLAFRFRSYAIEPPGASAAYVRTQLAHAALRDWERSAKAEKEILVAEER